jgi:hypothetical protein
MGPLEPTGDETMKLHINESPIDRAVRIVLGLVLAGVAVAGWLAAPILYVDLAVAAIALVTGVVGFCPLYALLRIGTAPARR